MNKSLVEEARELLALGSDWPARDRNLAKLVPSLLAEIDFRERETRAAIERAYERAARHVEEHSCVSSCCDAQPSAGEAAELAKCVRALAAADGETGGGT